MAIPKSQVYVYIPGDSTALNSYIDSVIQQFETDININLLIDFLNVNSSENQNYNLKVMKNILPLALSSSENYSFYYTYVNSIIDSSYITPYPYFIALSEKIIWISSDFDKILITYDKNVIQDVISKCLDKLKKYKRLLDINSNIVEMIDTVVENQGNATTLYCIEYEPCFSMYFSKEMFAAFIPDNVSIRKQLIEILSIRQEQLEKIKSSIQIFNKESIREFAETGIITEFPEKYSRHCTKEERLYILNCLIENIESENHIIRAINPLNMHISDCISLIVQEDVYVQFSIWNDRKIPLKYISITEQSICKYFLSFMKDLLDTSFLFSKEQTIDFVKEAIDYLKQL